jgi:hypothetical protein
MFTFTSPIHSFGIYIAGLGTAGPTTFSISNSNGFVANLFTNYEGTTVSFDTPLFAGLVSDSRFDAVSLWGTAVGDGIALDNLYYGHASPSAVPGAIVGAGLPGLVAACSAPRRQRKQADQCLEMSVAKNVGLPPMLKATATTQSRRSRLGAATFRSKPA